MRNFVNNVKNMFLYTGPKRKYNFSISKETIKETDLSEQIPNIISKSLDVNLNNIKLRYSSSINSDVILRKFKFNVYGKTYEAFIVLIDGMIDSNLVNDFLLKPLMETNNKKNIKTLDINGVKLKKNYKIDLKQYIHDKLIFENDINDAKNIDELIIRCKFW